MKATFYIHPEALRHNPEESEADYISKFSQLIHDLGKIVMTADVGNDINEFVYSSQLFETPIFQGQDIYTFAYTRMDRDTATFLNQVLSQSGEQSSFTIGDIEKRSVYSKDETSCHALVRLNNIVEITANDKYIQFNKYELVYNKNSWLTVRRQILGNHPGTSAEFMKKAHAYFPNLVFSCNCSHNIEDFLNYVPRKIVYYLSCMNDKLIEFYEKHPNKNSINTVLGEFAGQYGMDRAGSQQSTPAKKEKYTFSFTHDGSTIEKCCGPHFKITQADSNCPNVSKYHARIYFNIDAGTVFVGSIGPHI